MGLAILMAAIMATPLLFQHFWFKRWFRVCWWIGTVMIVAAVMGTHAQGASQNLDALEKSLMNEHVACLRKAAAHLDDGKSDASTIAAAIQEECSEQAQHLIEFEGREISAGDYLSYKKKMDDMMTASAIKIVLIERRENAEWDAAMAKLATPNQ